MNRLPYGDIDQIYFVQLEKRLSERNIINDQYPRTWLLAPKEKISTVLFFFPLSLFPPQKRQCFWEEHPAFPASWGACTLRMKGKAQLCHPSLTEPFKQGLAVVKRSSSDTCLYSKQLLPGSSKKSPDHCSPIWDWIYFIKNS